MARTDEWSPEGQRGQCNAAWEHGGHRRSEDGFNSRSRPLPWPPVLRRDHDDFPQWNNGRGGVDSLTSRCSADPWTQPDKVLCEAEWQGGGAPSPFELSLRMIYCVTSGMGPVYRQTTEPNRWVRLVLLGSCQEIRELNVQYWIQLINFDWVYYTNIV